MTSAELELFLAMALLAFTSRRSVQAFRTAIRVASVASERSDSCRLQKVSYSGGSGNDNRDQHKSGALLRNMAGGLLGLGLVVGAVSFKKQREDEKSPETETKRVSEQPVETNPSDAGQTKKAQAEVSSSTTSSELTGVPMTVSKRDAVPDLPSHVPYLLIGGGAASFAAYRAIKAADPRAKILIVAEENRLPYMRPPLSKEMWYGELPPRGSDGDVRFKQWNGRERSIYFEHPAFYTPHGQLPEREHGGIAVLKGRKVTRLDPTSRKAYLDNGAVITYDKCLLATGGTPKRHRILDRDPVVRSKTTTFRRIEDFDWLLEQLEHKRRILVVGGGFLGSELACALGHKSKELGDHEIVQMFPEKGNMAKVGVSRFTVNMCSG